MCEIDSWGQLKNKFLGHPSSLLVHSLLGAICNTFD